MNTPTLELPRLEGVPKRMTHAAGHALDARLLLALDDAGYLEDPDWQGRTAATTPYLLRAVFMRWWRRLTDDLVCLRMRLEISSTVGVDYGPHGEPRIAFLVWPGEWPVRYMKRRCEALERAHRGLAETALCDLEAGLRATVDCLTPHYALNRCASMAHWSGEQNELEALNNIREAGEREEDVDLYRRGEFFRAVPQWVVEAKRRVPQARLERVARGAGIPAKVAAATLALRKAGRAADRAYRYHDFDHPVQDEMHAVGVAGALRWSEDDDCARLFDDFMDSMANSGDAEEVCLDIAVATNGDAFVMALRAIEAMLVHARAVDTLAALLSTEARR